MDDETETVMGPREAIARLEERIEALAAQIESCRKFLVAGRVAIVLGGVLLLAILVGAIRSDSTGLTAALVAVLGGIVVLGSNRSTSKEAEAQLAQAEAQRDALIAQIELQDVGSRTLH